MKKIAITFGDPNSISPEITIKALNFLDLPSDQVILITSKNILDFYEKEFNLSLEKNYKTIEIPYKYEHIKPSIEAEEAGEFAFKTIIEACKLAQNREIDAIVTAPVSKKAMNLAGHNYSGQTEVLEQYLANSNQKAQMLFICSNFSLLLFTRHLPLTEVASHIKKDILIEKAIHLNNSLKTQLGIQNPKIAICALNPHSGENGLFGNEEIDEIIPAIKQLRQLGISIEGPFPADTLFYNCYNNICNYDCYIALYHDQGLIPVKLMERDECVNTTIGLDVIRTSPAHGTAFDIAGKNLANPQSMIRAIELALQFINI